MEARLQVQLGPDQAAEWYGNYTSARSQLNAEVLQRVAAIEPGLTDHGPDHIANVLDNADRLLGENGGELTGVELYVLCLSILFHDTGNVHGRKEHNKKVAPLYDHIRGSSIHLRQEKNQILSVTAAHCGTSGDGTKDTLKDVELTSSLRGHPVRLRDLAAILRFADELAEGPHRTSEYMQVHKLIPKDSIIYHSYANITEIFIDYGTGRIALTYNIEVASSDNQIADEDFERVAELLRFCYSRIIKLDQERKYAAFHSNMLSRFKTTTAQFNFWIRGEQQEIGLDPVRLTDLIVPGDPTRSIEDQDPNYQVTNICEKLKAYSEVTA